MKHVSELVMYKKFAVKFKSFASGVDGEFINVCLESTDKVVCP